MNPWVSLEQAKLLKEYGYDQAAEKTDMHYIITRSSGDIWLTDNVTEDLHYIGDSYAAPTVEEMMIALRHQSLEIRAYRGANWYVNGNYDTDLKESIVQAFEALKKKRS